MPCWRMDSARSARASSSKCFLGWFRPGSTWAMGRLTEPPVWAWRELSPNSASSPLPKAMLSFLSWQRIVFQQLLCQSLIGHRSPGRTVIGVHRLAVAGGLGEPDIPGDDGGKDLPRKWRLTSSATWRERLVRPSYMVSSSPSRSIPGFSRPLTMRMVDRRSLNPSRA